MQAERNPPTILLLIFLRSDFQSWVRPMTVGQTGVTSTTGDVYRINSLCHEATVAAQAAGPVCRGQQRRLARPNLRPSPTRFRYSSAKLMMVMPPPLRLSVACSRLYQTDWPR